MRRKAKLGDEWREGVKNGNGHTVAGVFVFLKAQVGHTNLVQVEFHVLMVQFFKIPGEGVEAGTGRGDGAVTAGMLLDERGTGAIKVGGGGLQFAGVAGERPAAGMGEARNTRDGDGLAVHNLRDVLAVQGVDGLGEGENLLVGEFHFGGVVF